MRIIMEEIVRHLEENQKLKYENDNFKLAMQQEIRSQIEYFQMLEGFIRNSFNMRVRSRDHSTIRSTSPISLLNVNINFSTKFPFSKFMFLIRYIFSF